MISVGILVALVATACSAAAPGARPPGAPAAQAPGPGGTQSPIEQAPATTAPVAPTSHAPAMSSPVSPVSPVSQLPAPAVVSPAAAPAGRATVERVVDGDTIIVSMGGSAVHVRLIGIDTPETVKPNSPVECFGPEASARLHELLAPGSAVELARDSESHDDYGRLLAYVFRSSDQLFVNLALVQDGYANALTIAPNTTFAEDFTAAAAAARSARAGLWRACPDPDSLFSSVGRR